MPERDMIFNKRIGLSDVETWLEIPECFADRRNQMDHQSFRRFLNLTDDILLYMTVLDRQPIGGTILFRDRDRLGLALLGVRMREEYIQSLLLSTIKASLPFFRTASIRDVDAIVSSETNPQMPFPRNLFLNPALGSALDEIGFEKVEDVLSIRFENIGFADVQMQDTVKREMSEDIRSFVWKSVGRTMVDCSHTWLSLLRASSDGELHAILGANGVVAVLGLEEYAKGLIVPVIGYEPESIAPLTLASAIAYEVDRRKTQWLEIRLIGEENREVVDSLKGVLCAEPIKTRHSLMKLRI
jgi:hypothetical protein